VAKRQGNDHVSVSVRKLSAKLDWNWPVSFVLCRTNRRILFKEATSIVNIAGKAKAKDIHAKTSRKDTRGDFGCGFSILYFVLHAALGTNPKSKIASYLSVLSGLSG
jgi:hypothetical protein